MTTPRSKGFFMPPEWAPHRRCWMAWPCNEELWGKRLDEARDAYAEVASTIAQFEPVTMIARPDDVAEVSIRCRNKVNAVPLDINDSWMRDFGPTFLLDGDGTLGGVDWIFNGWGGKFTPYDDDDALAAKMLERVEAQGFRAPLCAEGGALHVDGEGTLLVVEETLVNENRNPGKSREEVERVLMDYLAVDKVIWLPGALENDHTDGHVDVVACYAAPGKIIALTCGDEQDPNYEPLARNLEVLRSATDAKGRSLEIVEVEQPARFVDPEIGRIPFSYINFYVANGGVVIPSYDDPRDEAAFSAIAACFPDRKAVEVPARTLFFGGGGIHCITQQQPRSKNDPEPKAD